MRYTVCFLLDPDGYVLLQEKAHTDFKGKLNGVGGKFEKGEDMYDCAVREIDEETGIQLNRKDLTWLGTLELPENCDERHRNEKCILYFMAGIATQSMLKPVIGGIEPVAFVPIDKVLRAEWYKHTFGTGKGDEQFAGDGDLQYFLRRAVTQLMPNHLPPKEW